MTVYGVQTGVPQWVSSTSCNSTCNVSSNGCPDFVIKRHDTRPVFKVSLQDCTGLPAEELESDNLLVETSMWAKSKLKTAITAQDTYFSLADNIGFEQILTNDLIIMDRVRRPEQMLVTGFDETNKLIQVARGYNGTEACAWPKGTAFKIFRIKDAAASIEKVYQDIVNTDGTTTNQLTQVYLVYEWQPNDTCVPGCFMLEFKLLQMITPPTNLLGDLDLGALAISNIVPSFTPSTLSPIDFGCVLGQDVDWVRRYPGSKEGFWIQIIDSPTAEV